MNNNTQVYAQKVELLLRLMPIVMEEGVFAVHGGTAINLCTTMRFLAGTAINLFPRDGSLSYTENYPKVG